jgi:hypothetical protein
MTLTTTKTEMCGCSLLNRYLPATCGAPLRPCPLRRFCCGAHRYLAMFFGFLTIILFFSQGCASVGTIDVSNFGAKPNTLDDSTLAVRDALAAARQRSATRLVFPPGRYDFWPDRAEERYQFISNNDDGLKRITFPLYGLANLEIDGQGAQFVFHDSVSPFVIDHCKGITLRNFSIDWKRAFHSEGTVLAVGTDTIDLAIPEEFPYKFRTGLLVFTNERGDDLPYGGLLEFDPKKRETAFLAKDYWTAPGGVKAEEIGPRQVRLHVPNITATPGNVLVFGYALRTNPAIVLSDSAQTRIEDVNLYHAGGMGVIAQRCEDVELDRDRVTTPPGSKRVLSLTADATHFSNCTGKIVMSYCFFENMDDDHTNIHGIYVQVRKQLAPDALEIKLVHPQQAGFDYLVPGMPVELVHGPSMVTYGNAVVKSVDRLNKEYSHVTFEAPLPKEVVIGDVIASTAGYPDVDINHCTFRGNRARGLLIGSRGKVVIENNLFHNAGAAILFEGDGRFWFEQAGVRDCVIRYNRFEDCNYGLWGNAAIQVGANIAESERAASRYNKNILIEDNTFFVFDPRILHVYSVQGLTFRNNRIAPSTDYPPQNQNAKAFDVTDSDEVWIDQK